MRKYFAEVHPGGTYAFCSRANVMLTDGQTWRAFLMGVKGSKWHVLRGYHAFRHSFASNLAAYWRTYCIRQSRRCRLPSLT